MLKEENIYVCAIHRFIALFMQDMAAGIIRKTSCIQPYLSRWFIRNFTTVSPIFATYIRLEAFSAAWYGSTKSLLQYLSSFTDVKCLGVLKCPYVKVGLILHGHAVILSIKAPAAAAVCTF